MSTNIAIPSAIPCSSVVPCNSMAVPDTFKTALTIRDEMSNLNSDLRAELDLVQKFIDVTSALGEISLLVEVKKKLLYPIKIFLEKKGYFVKINVEPFQKALYICWDSCVPNNVVLQNVKIFST
jgi:hypothetical protein